MILLGEVLLQVTCWKVVAFSFTFNKLSVLEHSWVEVLPRAVATKWGVTRATDMGENLDQKSLLVEPTGEAS